MAMKDWFFFVLCGGLILLISCNTEQSPSVVFKKIESSESNVFFENKLELSEKLNAYTFRNFFNGAGVALGDINNDGLLDIYFSGNTVDNKLYLNEGDFKFKDISVTAGVDCPNTWSTGVTMVDVNGDGWLDIYVCKSGPHFGGVRHNELFINNHDLTFTEKSREWGVDHIGLSVQAAFFDYDRDGDLDLYLLNNSNRSVGVFDLRKGQRNERDPFGGNKLMKNVGGKFVDVSQEAGIFGSAIGFGLGVVTSDVNRDHWPDIYVANDFFERDYLYLNNGDGTFKECLDQLTQEISMGSMGVDIADVDNNGYPEIFVTEMLPDNFQRVHTKISFETYEKYQSSFNEGYHRQFNRNVLQLNNGLIPGSNKLITFTEIGRYSNVFASDWSWSGLFFDYDNDGNRDIFVSNGIPKDLLDQDFIHFEANKILDNPQLRKDSTLLMTLMNELPSSPIMNCLYRNNGNLKFTNVSQQVGLTDRGFSNGAAYGDLNNDGLLDLVVNNINSKATIYKNQTEESYHDNFLQISLTDTTNNKFGIGAWIEVFAGEKKIYSEVLVSRGYLSSSDLRVHIGLGETKEIDSIKVLWSDGKCNLYKTTKVNTLLKLHRNDGLMCNQIITNKPETTYFTELKSDIPVITNTPVRLDFNNDKLLFENSFVTKPVVAQADINKDGINDYYFGTNELTQALFFIGDKTGGCTEKQIFSQLTNVVDTDAHFVDMNDDGVLDLFVSRGSAKEKRASSKLKNAIYIQKSDGNLYEVEPSLTGFSPSWSTMMSACADVNGDKKLDIVLAGFEVPYFYGKPLSIKLLLNTGNTFFSDVTEEKISNHLDIGHITDLKLVDMDQDSDLDLMLVGHWMGLRYWRNDEGKFSPANIGDVSLLNGLWNTIEFGDFNNDGLKDILLGNAGLNSVISKTPLGLFINDFDNNGVKEQVLCFKRNDAYYPYVLYSDMLKQIPSVRKKNPTYLEYSRKNINEIFDKSSVTEATLLTADFFCSVLLLNQGRDSFKIVNLPTTSQLTKLYDFYVLDFDHDQFSDVIFVGNDEIIKPQLGTNMGISVGLLKGNGDGSFNSISFSDSGLYLQGECREVFQDGNKILFIVNNDSIKTFSR